MRLLAEYFPEFSQKLDEIDELYKEKRTIDEKIYQFICFALAIKNRSVPCVKKHFKGALEAGATVKELSYIMALTFRESAVIYRMLTEDREYIVRKELKKAA
jgi:AhpD family alkylhydroperoxidase